MPASTTLTGATDSDPAAFRLDRRDFRAEMDRGAMPAALIVAVTLIVVFAPEASEAIVQGSAAQPLPLTFVIVRLVGVSVTWMFVAVEGPPLATTSV